MRVVVTGHRPSKLGGYDENNPIITHVKSQITAFLMHTKPYECITGMAIGVDQIFFEICIRLGIDVHAYIPFKGQELMWPKQSIEKYHTLLNKATRIVICDTNVTCHTYHQYLLQPLTAYSAHKMQVRNQYMVDTIIPNVDILLAIWDETPGGTANCVKYAISKGLTIGNSIHIITPNPLTSIVTNLTV